MKKFILFAGILTAFSILLSGAGNRGNAEGNNFSRFSFFVKTTAELPVSEATGKIMLSTGFPEIDRVISEYGVEEITNVFKLNNGDPGLFNKLEMGRIYLFSRNSSPVEGISEAVKNMSAASGVEYAELNHIGRAAGTKVKARKPSIPNDASFSKQWYLMNNGYVKPSGGGSPKIGADINMLRAWDVESGSDTIIVAILDSGIKDDHPDLAERIWINSDEIPGNGKDDDNNGYVDDFRGWDFAYDDRKPGDGFGHGTNIATVIGASVNNQIGFAGVDRKCRLMNCKNLNSDNSGEYSWWSKSIKYAVDNGAHIINMSEGGDDPSKVLHTAINYALESGIMVIAAMMNKGDNADYYPAVYDGVLAVGATDSDDNRCRRFSWGGGSCWGDHISVVAPGNKIYGLDYEDDENFEVYWSGTSQSTAIVSGIAALLLAQDGTRDYRQLQKIIKLSSKDLVGDPAEDKPGWDEYYGYGRVDCFAALTYSMSDQEVMDIMLGKNKENEQSRDLPGIEKGVIPGEEPEREGKSNKPTPSRED